MEAKQEEKRRNAGEKEAIIISQILLPLINACETHSNADRQRRQEDVGGTYMRILCRTWLGQEL